MLLWNVKTLFCRVSGVKIKLSLCRQAVAGIMDGRLIFVFKEVALQEMQFVTAESTILSPQWLFPSCLPLFSACFPDSRSFLGAQCGFEWFPHHCRAVQGSPWLRAWQMLRRGDGHVCLNILYKYHCPFLPGSAREGIFGFLASLHLCPQRIPSPLPPRLAVRGSQLLSKC